jgi:16S rRNA (cytidine1402-2'-O)-methyltransferase
MSTLYIVPTPIGNLEDITLRALRILKEVRLIAAEDTRTTKVLLDHYEIKTPLISYHEHNKLRRLEDIFAALAEGDVALVSDAGTPGISDPGYELVSAAIEHQVSIVPLPGANAAITALVASGLPTNNFVYLGFLPRKTSRLREFAEEIREEQRTLVLYESPHRIRKTVAVLLEVLGDRPAVLARELTKLYEEIIRGTLGDLMVHFAENQPRGEMVLVIRGAPQDTAGMIWDEPRVRAALQARLADGEKRSEAVKAIAAESGWDRRTLYDMDIQR